MDDVFECETTIFRANGEVESVVRYQFQCDEHGQVGRPRKLGVMALFDRALHRLRRH